MRRLFCLLFWTCSSISAQAQSDADSYTDLAVLVAAAESSYPSLQAHAARIEAAQARIQEARFSPFFQWEANAGFTLAPRAQGTPIFSDQDQLPLDNGWAPVAEVGLRGVIPLYTFGKIRNLRRLARAGAHAAEQSLEQRRAQLRRDVRRAYFTLQMALDIQQMIGEGRPKLIQAIEKLEELLADGDPETNPMDRYRLEAALAEIDARASQTERLKRGAQAALRILTGLSEIRPPDCPMEPIDVNAPTLERLHERAREQRPEIGMLEAALDAREANLDIQRAGYAPDFGLGFQASYSWGPGVTDQENPWISDPANRQSLGAGLVMRWRLDFAGNIYRVRRARAQLRETRAQVDEARAGINLEVELALHALEDSRQQEEAWRRGRQQTRAWFVSSAQAYEIGAIEPKDLIDALKAYFQARFEHLRSIHQVNTAAAELERVAGENLIDADGWETSCE